VSQARRFETNGTQFEVDAYPRISENQYLYLNLGLSNSSIYPAQRGGFELNTSLPKAFEASLGFRVLHFSGSKRVIIYTGSLGKYVGNYWFSLRPFVTPNENDASFSVYFLTRRYFTDPENYIGVRLGIGSSPDERLKIIQTIQQLSGIPTGSARLKSQSAKLEFNHLIKNSWIGNAGISINREEYFQYETLGTQYGINYTFDINIAYQF
jgi:YaiO family outer membrane protein